MVHRIERFPSFFPPLPSPLQPPNYYPIITGSVGVHGKFFVRNIHQVLNQREINNGAASMLTPGEMLQPRT